MRFCDCSPSAVCRASTFTFYLSQNSKVLKVNDNHTAFRFAKKRSSYVPFGPYNGEIVKIFNNQSSSLRIKTYSLYIMCGILRTPTFRYVPIEAVGLNMRKWQGSCKENGKEKATIGKLLKWLNLSTYLENHQFFV